jgi:hypothetical protein
LRACFATEVLVDQVQMEVNEPHDRLKEIVVHVNNLPVRLAGHRHSGLEIKEAAIEQGVDIRLDFALYEEIGHDRTKHIRDDEIVEVTDETRFLADVEIITIHVNGPHHPVRVEGRHQTGLSIKEAAISQGVKIKLDFILLEVGHGPSRPIKDDEPVEVNDHSKFDAIPDDDHS